MRMNRTVSDIVSRPLECEVTLSGANFEKGSMESGGVTVVPET